MFFWSLLSQGLTGLAGLAAVVINFIFKDGRTTKHKLWVKAFIYLSVASFISSLFFTYFGYTDSKTLSSNIDSLKQTTKDLQYALTKKSDTLLDRSKLLKPFLEMAMKQYPKLPPDLALKKLESNITINIYNKPIKRVLQDTTLSRIGNQLKQLSKAAYQLWYSISDPEAHQLGLQLDNLFQNAGWQSVPALQHVAGPPFDEGIRFYLKKENETFFGPIAYELSKSLGGKGITYTLVSASKLNQFADTGNNTKLPEDLPTVVIYVGPNPDN